MTALSLSPLSFPTWTFRKAQPEVDDTVRIDDAERRMIIGDMIAAGACDNEHGVQTLMSVFPDQF